MSVKENGGPAFPVPGDQQDESFNGATLRDYFAAKAIQALIITNRYPSGAAKEAYMYADAMLLERAQ